MILYLPRFISSIFRRASLWEIRAITPKKRVLMLDTIVAEMKPAAIIGVAIGTVTRVTPSVITAPALNPKNAR